MAEATMGGAMETIPACPVRPSSFRDALTALASAQKSSKGAPIYSLLINRPLGRVFAAAAYRLGLTPNRVTLISALCTYSAIVLIAVSAPGLGLALGVTTLLVLGYALDAADGQLARLRGGGSLAGEWLDHVIDSGKIATLHLAVAIMVFRHFGLPVGWVLVPLGFAAVSVVHFFGMLLTELLGRLHNAETGAPRVAAQPSTAMSVAKLPTDYGLLCLSFLLLADPVVFFWLYALLALAMVGYTALVMFVWFGRVSRLRH